MFIFEHRQISTEVGYLYNIIYVYMYAYLLPEFTFSRMFKNFPLVISRAEKMIKTNINHVNAHR